MSEISKVQVASLSPQAVSKLEQIEHQLGAVVVVAYEKPVVPAKLSADQLAVLKKAEAEMGVCLVAYEA
jgi:hypothetical protein